MRIALPSFVLLCSLAAIALPCLADESSHESAAGAAQAGVEDLSFSDFYVMPVGPLGLEPTPKLLSLSGKRVRLVGYMVHEEEPTTGVFMLAPQPVQLAEVADGPADDLPPSTVFIHMPAKDQQQVVPYRAGLWTLTGTLELGGQSESNGRISYTRLRLEPAPVEQSRAPASDTRAAPRS